ncbi:RraA family protein [Paraburkholderia fungorum]|uniref:Putative 4-hydroxy-4-methyl-2-oxoglutarate aldolase n=1 Tax=Paraburkholderia fungorum TaxID=134537 RepID=A0A420FND1_9BURK|nr:RraA family protein [Paraburkholderia fungorum]RKF34429.1 methyltransferase [Paraburkholderia fungorum]
MPIDNFVLHPAPPLAPALLLEAFQNVATPHISDNLMRLAGVTGLHRFHRERKLLGTAVTVKVRPGDNLLIYKALMEMSPGHVLIVDGGGDATNALVGELLMLYAQQRGCAGFVIDGAVRDTAAFYDADFPCYARGASHRGPYKQGPGAINVPVSVGGHVVHPGDIVVGDEDGVVTFPVSAAPSLLDAIHRTAANEDAVKAEIATGAVHQSWLDRMLSSHGLL